MPEPQPESEHASKLFLLLVWAIGATVTTLVSTAAAIFLYLHGRGPEETSAGWRCWEKSTGGNGHFYKAVTVGSAVTWSEAEALAREQGGYLATITSRAENDFVFGLVNGPEFFNVEHGAGPALGGFQQDGSAEPAGGWCWQTGEPWVYSNWMPGEPNNGKTREGTEDRLMFYSGIPRTPAATWNDINRVDRNNLMVAYVMERNH